MKNYFLSRVQNVTLSAHVKFTVIFFLVILYHAI